MEAESIHKHLLESFNCALLKVIYSAKLKSKWQLMLHLVNVHNLVYITNVLVEHVQQLFA